MDGWMDGWKGKEGVGQRTSLLFYINTRYQSVPGRQKRGFEAMRKVKKTKKKKGTVCGIRAIHQQAGERKRERARVVVTGCLLQSCSLSDST